jgi:hypothetical protein
MRAATDVSHARNHAGKLDALNFALAGGISLALSAALATSLSLLGVPGFPQFTTILINLYGAYGYAVSPLGVLVGALWGFVEGFVHLGLLAVIYNTLVAR